MADVHATITDHGWDDTPQTVDLSTSTADKLPPLDSEVGSVLSWSDSLFTDYLDPTVGSIHLWEARDYAQMLRTDGQARKVEAVLTHPLFSAGYTFEGVKGDKGEAEWVTDVFSRPANNGGMSTPLRLVLAQMTSAVTYRVASFEKVLTRDDEGRVVYDKLAFRPAVNTRVQRDKKSGAYRGLEQDPPAGGYEPVKIPANRSFTYVHGQHRHPVLGSSDMEIPLTCWRTKQKLKFLWFLFLELHAQPRVAWSPTGDGGSYEGAKQAAQKWAKLRAGGSVPLSQGVSGQVMEAGGHAADLYMGALKYLDSEMTGQVLAQFSDLASAAADGTGSFAMSRDQSDFYMMSRRMVADEMSDAFTNFVVADLIRYNYGPRGKVPRFKLGPLVKPDLETMLGALGTIDQAKVPAEFYAYLIESTAQLLDMPTDKVQAMVKAMAEAAEKAAATPAQAALAPVAGAVAAADQLVKETAREGDTPAAAKVRAAAKSAARAGLAA